MALSTSKQGNQPPVPAPVRTRGSVAPDRLYVDVPGLEVNEARRLSRQAVTIARALAPKMSGAGAASIQPYAGTGFFGLRWERPYMWEQESGARPFTMRTLAGKTIPMWVDDPTGQQHAANPKAKTRITASGRKQILIFRRAGKIGARKTVVRRDAQGRLQVRDVPQSYPGAPGRISHREVTAYPPYATTGRIAKLVTRSHVGVRWRHPGIQGRQFMHFALQSVAVQNRYLPVINQAYRRR